MLALVLYVPLVRDLFRFSRLHQMDLVICSIKGVFRVLWFEGAKDIRPHSCRPWHLRALGRRLSGISPTPEGFGLGGAGYPSVG